jgi:hypothetical protein
MTVPIRRRVPLAASDEPVTIRRSAARHDRATAGAGVLPAKPRHAGSGLIPLLRLSARDRADETVVRLIAELDLSGMAAAKAQLRDVRWRARARSAAALTGLPVPGRGAKACTGAVRSAIRAALRTARYERRRHVQPRHAHGLVLGAYQRAVILAPCRTSGLRRGTLYRESRQS